LLTSKCTRLARSMDRSRPELLQCLFDDPFDINVGSIIWTLWHQNGQTMDLWNTEYELSFGSWNRRSNGDQKYGDY